MAVQRFPLRQRSEQLAATLPPLMVAAERVAITIAQGVHGRRRVGQGETFWQFRRYEPGDRPQIIDWRQSAKTTHVFVRETEWEAAQSVWIWRDTSKSMSWRSSQDWPEKRGRADLLALALMVLLVRGGERVSLYGSGLSPSTGQATLTRMATLVERTGTDGADLPTFEPLPRYAQVVMLGDFLAPIEEIERTVRRFAESGVRGHLLQVLDPAEETLPYGGRVRFEGLQDETPWLLSRVESVRPQYLNRLSSQREGLDTIARANDWSYSSHRTDRPPQTALLALYLALSQRLGN